MKRILSCIYLGHNFTKEQQQESEYDGNAEELKPIGTTKVDDMCKKIVAQDDDSNINQIVGNQNGC